MQTQKKTELVKQRREGGAVHIVDASRLSASSAGAPGISPSPATWPAQLPGNVNAPPYQAFPAYAPYPTYLPYAGYGGFLQPTPTWSPYQSGFGWPGVAQPTPFGAPNPLAPTPSVVPPNPVWPPHSGFLTAGAQTWAGPAMATNYAPPGQQAIGTSPEFPQGPNFVPFSSTVQRVPPCDVVDEGSEFVCQIELPGVKQENIECTCLDRGVVVTATGYPDIDLGALVQSERGTTLSYRRVVTLPAEVQPAGCKATLRDGILTLNLPKATPTEGPRRIEVQS